MSRIHDALKRAEQERADTDFPGVAPRGIEPTVPGGSQPGAPPLAPETGLLPTVPAPDHPHTAVEVPQLLLNRCIRHSWNPDRKTMLYFDRRNPGAGLEEFRTLRSHLYLIHQEKQVRTLLITSPLPLEGKTFVAANLAQVIVRQREPRVLLIDADMRASRMHLSFGTPRTPGLTDYLSGVADVFSVVQRGPLDNLFLIPGGSLASNPSELIGTGRLRLLLDRLAPAFDWIILDSPPVIPVSDAKLLADHCDGVLVVIQAGVTPFDLAQKTCREFREKRLLGVVLNRVERGTAYGSYYYDNKSRSKMEPGAGKDSTQ